MLLKQYVLLLVHFAYNFKVKAAVKIPTLVGSGVTVQNVHDYLAASDALIVGSHFKVQGHWANPVEKQRVEDFMTRVKSLRRV